MARATKKKDQGEAVQLAYNTKKQGVGHPATVNGKELDNCVTIQYEGMGIVIPYGTKTKQTFPKRIAAHFVGKSRSWGGLGAGNAPVLSIVEMQTSLQSSDPKPLDKMGYNELAAEAKERGLDVKTGGPEAIGKEKLVELLAAERAK